MRCTRCCPGAAQSTPSRAEECACPTADESSDDEDSHGDASSGSARDGVHGRVTESDHGVYLERLCTRERCAMSVRVPS